MNLWIRVRKLHTQFLISSRLVLVSMSGMVLESGNPGRKRSSKKVYNIKMGNNFRHSRPTLGVLAGWQFYRTATNLSYLDPVFRGISCAARDFGCNLLLGCGLGPSASPTDPLRPAWPMISSENDYVPIGLKNTDGLIIANPLHSKERSDYVRKVITVGHPVIFIGAGENGPSIVAHNSSGIFDALQHLKGHGHQRVAFIAGTLEDMEGDSGERLKAYQLGCEQFGFAQDPRLIVYGRHVYPGGFHAMQELLNGGVDFTAALASNDESALGAMKAIEEAGRKIPQDVAIIGFDNRLEGAVNEPGLSSIHVPLFSLGYRAVELMLAHLEGSTDLNEREYVETRLVIRESCGCNQPMNFVNDPVANKEIQLSTSDEQISYLVGLISTAVMNQAQNLTEEKCLSLSQNLVKAFLKGIQSGNSQTFSHILEETLRITTSSNDDPHIWQAALSLLEKWSSETYGTNLSFGSISKNMISEGRLKISLQVQRYHSQYIIDERWKASQLSLLTARLLNALDEQQIFEILADYLPAMNIQTAMLSLIEGKEEDLDQSWSIGNLLVRDQQPIKTDIQMFPPPGLFDPDTAFQLTLIPVVDPTKQLGFIAFDSEHLDLYGAIVQQLGGALNKARLYRHATEGRRLAEEANRMKSNFLSTISHELRTPLNLIVGLSGILMEESDEEKSLLPESVQQDISRINAYAQHLGGLIGDVIDLASNEAGQLRLNMEMINLGELLKLVADSGSQLTADKGLIWKADIPQTGPFVWGDRTRLRQVVLNLVNNAVKFTTYGSVSMTVETGDGNVTIRVCDTGLGIPLEEQSLIFNEFRRSERSIELGYPGLGLGLSISKMLIEIHNGKIGLESSGVEGEGSCFYFTLSTVGQPLDQDLTDITVSQIKPTVLFLVTQDNTSKQLCTLLENRGIDVKIVLMDQPSQWMSLLSKFPPDAIILDVSIQSDLGWNVLREIKNSHLARGIPILFYSFSDEGDGLLNLDYLTKPIELSDLTQAFDHVRLMFESDQAVRTFLVVDDDPNTLEVHSRIVKSQSSSYRVLQAQDGFKALNILKKEKVDVVLLDLQMPKLDGFGVLEAMRADKKLREIPVIVVTGKVLTDEDMSRLNQGVTTILNKGMFSREETVIHITNALEQKRKLNQEAKKLVRQAMSYIHEHFSEQISRQDLATLVNISEDYMTFCFRQELGISPIKYLQRFRINQAKMLLKASQKSITEIAFEVGFLDSGYFSRIFHRETGVSPGEYRSLI
ncbi:MAG: substrate-binding domain-containing protein [Anaerolineaceae bacterium]|nr:substrate-binding domain-containing protein [Anaerolineaceae bacterium]